MNSIFNYQTLKANLDKATRTLNVQLNRPQYNNSINLEMLFELESLLSWASTRVEIRSIYINSATDRLSDGFDIDLLSSFSSKQVEKLVLKLQKIVYALLHLPQTVIVDINKGCSNIACELAIGADLRVCHKEAQVEFDHLEKGLTPSSGGISLLTQAIGQGNAKNWIMSSQKISAQRLENTGFVVETYNTDSRSNTIKTLLNDIHKQAPVQRIQTKFGLFQTVAHDNEKNIQIEKQISKASLISEDWKEIHTKGYMPSKSMGQAVKLSIVKDSNKETPIN